MYNLSPTLLNFATDGLLGDPASAQRAHSLLLVFLPQAGTLSTGRVSALKVGELIALAVNRVIYRPLDIIRLPQISSASAA